MNAVDVDAILTSILDDRRLTPTERQALQAVLMERRAGEALLTLFRSRAFALARASVKEPRSREVITWLEETVEALHAPRTAEMSRMEAHFTPGDGPLNAIIKQVQDARGSIDVCVYTVTDDRITRALLEAHRNGVRLRVVGDDDKALDAGSDMHRLRDAGVPVRLDRSEAHMHHKFAVFDRLRLVTGSYNWTRSAAEHNHENILVSDDARLVQPFSRAFDALWDTLA
ncbi:phospholipase D-like domain-containing protein [Pyxidicoccus xibeiensis]|uniref:phospholipase D-like domain-containing protein n=1 Tax=Pyxidicoccus xibeiensis TaxID=2906759 RepID=UPI0020A75369|nr:phospholipase D-like domain-containing protein [Pyxidicoccus xibeiensis]MCP3144723.1 phospholipase D-like domain-containing protein [Pyxidicoccus xibeiensis]